MASALCRAALAELAMKRVPNGEMSLTAYKPTVPPQEAGIGIFYTASNNYLNIQSCRDPYAATPVMRASRRRAIVPCLLLGIITIF